MRFAQEGFLVLLGLLLCVMLKIFEQLDKYECGKGNSSRKFGSCAVVVHCHRSWTYYVLKQAGVGCSNGQLWSIFCTEYVVHHLNATLISVPNWRRKY